MAFTDQIDLAHDPIFQKRVQYAIVQSAVNVRAESPATANHSQRSNWAGQVLGNPAGYAALMAPAFVTQGPIAGNAVCTSTGCSAPVTDAQLQGISDSLWNDFSCA